jgi:hypothetical protein
MFFWAREIAGWLLIAMAIFLVRIAVIFISERLIVEAGVLALMMMVLLKAGVLLIRISTAARISMSKHSPEL